MLQKFNPQNENIQVWVGQGLLPRNEAKVSVFDSSVQGGDAIWEGLRRYKEGVFCLDKHIDRLYESAKALAFVDIPDRGFIKHAIKETLEANGMSHDTHIRLTLTRGEKVTSGMDPRLNQNGSCLIVLSEWKPLVYDNEKGIKVITSTQRRNNPQFLDSKIHHANLLNNILAKIQANFANVDAAIMLDHQGFVAELNDTNLFMIRDGKLYTPFADACLHGITRGLVIEIARKLGIEVVEKNLSLVEFYNADEVFATGTMGELTPVNEIDGRKIENKSGIKLRAQLQEAFSKLIPDLCEQL
ncbi:MAG: aminotransferase IV [Flammeovirgaceae bacterium]|nr:aminotransferase IV [Flammeovirgaceae bacterium]MBE63187.1 aminotransferase IV [Flammeovirgaceae bacterium]MBR09094.1 aminotransferase IV [Rickettsiales bacterium]HCX24964.1 aminotransferase IV [Cytophagales bacterium]|tara:strand:- start:68 stop:967 length:900 start_codon:yes stop_codon:yes gene_type:complete